MNVQRLNKFCYDLQNIDRIGYKFHCNGNITMLSSDFAIMLNFLLKQPKNINTNSLSNCLLKQQNENGLFIEHDFSLADTSGSHKEDYILWQFTYFTTIALDMLGCKPKYSFNFLKPLFDKNNLRNWFNKLNWDNFWYSSNQIMFFMYFLTYLKERRGYDARLANDLIQECFDILDTKQDSNTGFWGNNLSENLFNGMCGAAHIYLFYDYYDRKINHVEKIIDNTLSLQNENGLFGSKFGGACEDYDAIEILSKVSKHTDYRKEDVHRAIMKTYMKINSRQQKNGGFSYCFKEESLIETIKRIRRIILSRNKSEYSTYSYSGWTKMTCKLFVPDIWATYFRSLTLAVIEKDTPELMETNFNFYDLPGWGYYSKN